MAPARVRGFLMRSRPSASSCRPGASPIPARVLGIYSTRRGHQNRGKVQRCRAGPFAYWRLPDRSVARSMDCPDGVRSTDDIKKFADRHGVLPGSINPNLFQDQEYKYGSFGNPDPEIRQRALQQPKTALRLPVALHSRDVSMWFADGSNYPGTANIRQRKQWFAEVLKASHDALFPGQTSSVEYKPFEPAFYHTDIADWGMSLLLSRSAGPQAKVLVDTGHHYAAQNIEQIVAWLLSEDMLGGFHFNDRRYADDDLTIGSIDPYQVFRIFMRFVAWSTMYAMSAACRFPTRK